MTFLYGLLTATGAIIAAEIAFGYSLGDFLKDFFVRLFGKAESFVEARITRLENKAKALRAKL